MKRPNVPHVVYVCRDEHGALLYVGCTSQFGRRKAAHRYKSPWWATVAVCDVESQHPDYRSAHARERFLIATLEPVHNVKHNPRGDEDERAWQLAQAAAGVSVSPAVRGYVVAAERARDEGAADLSATVGAA